MGTAAPPWAGEKDEKKVLAISRKKYFFNGFYYFILPGVFRNVMLIFFPACG